MTKHIFLSAFFLLFHMISVHAQDHPVLENDYTYSMNVPDVVAMRSTAAHMYVLSGRDGMAVFRTHPDSLQWLYTASGMQQRGHTLRADIRFAYLSGNNKRLTVLEPTSVMGAYSATTLPQRPLDVLRFGNNLYVALGPGGMGELNLKTPETLDSSIKSVSAAPLKNQSIVSLTGSPDRMYAISSKSRLFIFGKDNTGISFKGEQSLKNNINKLFWLNNKLIGSNDDGSIFEINDTGTLQKIGSIGERVDEILPWKQWLIIRGQSKRLWTSYQFKKPVLWKKNANAGNFITVSKKQLWISQYNRINKIRTVSPKRSAGPSGKSGDEATGSLQLQSINNQIIPFPHALLIPLKLTGNYPVGKVEFNVQSDVENTHIRGQSLYWKPAGNQKGRHQFKVIATTPSGTMSSVNFTVDVTSFNTPPRFTPMRTISTPVNRSFNLPVRAIDPDATDKSLIRYIGVNLPQGSSVNEQTGRFSWTPSERQLGDHSFRVIATDQYGAATSQKVKIKVIKANNTNN